MGNLGQKILFYSRIESTISGSYRQMTFHFIQREKLERSLLAPLKISLTTSQ